MSDDVTRQVTETNPDNDTGSAKPVIAGVRCIQCGYSLDKLLTSGTCPECSRSIAETMRGDLLIFESPAYLHRVYLGYKLHYFGLVTFIAMVLLGFASMFRIISILAWFELTILVTVFLCMHFGSLFIATPNKLNKPEYVTLTIRSLSAIQIAMLALTALMFAVNPFVTLPLNLASLLILSMMLIFIIITVCIGRLTSWYAARSNDQILSRRMSTLGKQQRVLFVTLVIIIILHQQLLTLLPAAASFLLPLLTLGVAVVCLSNYIEALHSGTMLFKKTVNDAKQLESALPSSST